MNPPAQRPQSALALFLLIIFLMFALTMGLTSCGSAPKPADPFDTAINASLGAMVGGIMGPHAGGEQ